MKIKTFFTKRLIERFIRDKNNEYDSSVPKNKRIRYYSELYFKTINGRLKYEMTIHGDTVELHEYTGNNPVTITVKSFRELAKMPFFVEFHIKGKKFQSSSVIYFEVMNTIKIYNIRAYLNKFLQWKYNKKTIATLDRFAILKHIVEETIIDPKKTFNINDVIKKIFKDRVVGHPQYMPIMQYYEFIFQSLEEEGFIFSDKGKYKLRPKALTALSTYEEDKQRHKNSIAVQKILLYITALSVAGIFIQAYIAYIATWK